MSDEVEHEVDNRRANEVLVCSRENAADIPVGIAKLVNIEPVFERNMSRSPQGVSLSLASLASSTTVPHRRAKG